MVRGPKKHLKRLNAPKHWMLDKLGGIFAPKPSAGPHKTRECLPLILLVRNRLKYALTGREVTAILQNRHILVDGKVRTDRTYPVGFMDVVTIPATEERFRVIYDAKGRFAVHRISEEEAAYKLVKVTRQQIGKGAVPYVATHDGRTIRYPDPAVRVGDTLVLDIASGKPTDFIRHDVGALVMVTGGHNNGRVGTIVHKEKHRGSFDVVRVRDAAGHEFATRATNIFVIGKDDKPLVSLPKGKGIRESILQEQARVYGKGAEAH